MTSFAYRFAVSAVLLSALVGCGSSEETYEASILPSHVRSAVLHVKKGKGQLRVEYANQVFVADGKIEESPTPRSFALVRDSDDDKFLKFEFIWRLELNAWVCLECLRPIGHGPIGESSVLWVKK